MRANSSKLHTKNYIKKCKVFELTRNIFKIILKIIDLEQEFYWLL